MNWRAIKDILLFRGAGAYAYYAGVMFWYAIASIIYLVIYAMCKM